MKIKTKAKLDFNVGDVDRINDKVCAKIVNINTDLKNYNIIAELFTSNAGVDTTLKNIAVSINRATYASYLNKFTSDKLDKLEAQEHAYYYALLEEMAKVLKLTVAGLEIID